MSETGGGKRPTHRAYFIKNEDSEKGKMWLEIGAGWAAKDGGISVVIDRMPYEGLPLDEPLKVHLRPVKPAE